MSEAYYKDEGLNLDGAFVTLERRPTDGRLVVEIDTTDCDQTDWWPSLKFPRLLICINQWTFQVMPDGSLQPVAE